MGGEVDLEVVDLVGAVAREVAEVEEEVAAVPLPTSCSAPIAVTLVPPTAYLTAPVVRSSKRKSASRLIRRPVLTRILLPPALSAVGMVPTSSVAPWRLRDAALPRVNRFVQTSAKSSASQRRSACARPPSLCKSKRSAFTS